MMYTSAHMYVLHLEFICMMPCVCCRLYVSLFGSVTGPGFRVVGLGP